MLVTTIERELGGRKVSASGTYELLTLVESIYNDAKEIGRAEGWLTGSLAATQVSEQGVRMLMPAEGIEAFRAYVAREMSELLGQRPTEPGGG